jgi:hypothetical protein
VKTLARGNARLHWKQVDEDFWRKYSTDTLPAIVEQRAKTLEARTK